MLTPRLFHARSTLQMVMVARHDHHAHRVDAATLSDRRSQGRTDGSWIRTDHTPSEQSKTMSPSTSGTEEE